MGLTARSVVRGGEAGAWAGAWAGAGAGAWAACTARSGTRRPGPKAETTFPASATGALLPHALHEMGHTTQPMAPGRARHSGLPRRAHGTRAPRGRAHGARASDARPAAMVPHAADATASGCTTEAARGARCHRSVRGTWWQPVDNSAARPLRRNLFSRAERARMMGRIRPPQRWAEAAHAQLIGLAWGTRSCGKDRHAWQGRHGCRAGGHRRHAPVPDAPRARA